MITVYVQQGEHLPIAVYQAENPLAASKWIEKHIIFDYLEEKWLPRMLALGYTEAQIEDCDGSDLSPNFLLHHTLWSHTKLFIIMDDKNWNWIPSATSGEPWWQSDAHENRETDGSVMI